MMDAIGAASSFGPDVPFVVMLLIKATTVLCIGAVVAFAFRDAAASVRHAVWALTLAAALALPLGMIATPAWRVAVLPSMSSSAATEGNAGSGSAATTATGNASTSAEGSAATTGETWPLDPVTAASRAGANPSPSNVARQVLDVVPVSPAPLIAILWLSGVVFVLGRMIAGRITLARIARRATSLDTPEWRSLRVREGAITGAGSGVSVLASAEVSSPLMSGSRSPVILLPEESLSWRAEHRTVVVRHEMAHVASGDATVCLVAGVACAVYWFHPLIWMAARQMKKEQERACDDRVLALGIPRTEYASHLLEVARSARDLGMQGFVSVAMARPSQLEGRLLAVLNESRSHATITRRRRIAAAVTAVAMLVPIAAFVPVSTAVSAPAIPAAAIIVTGQFDGGIAPAIRRRSAAGDAISTVDEGGLEKSAVTADSTLDGQVAVASGGTLDLDLRTGAALDISGWDEPVVRMRATLGGRDWRNTELAINGDGTNARVVARHSGRNQSHSTSHRIELRVPRRFNIRISSAGGALSIRDVNGSFTGATGGGEIRIERARGHAELGTGGGPVDVVNSTLSGSVSTGGGAVLIQNVTGGLTGSSGTGNVIYGGKGGVTFSGETARGGARVASDGSLHVRKSGGTINLGEAPNGADVRTGGGPVRIGAAGGRVYASTGGGDIDIGPVRGSAEAHTGAGDVTITLTGRSQSVDVTSGNGEVTLIVPAGLSATLDLETAYTNNRRNPTRIESDWSLSTSETRDWDSAQGTPRRYVRARQSIGGGGETIRVRTVNGNIRIKRSP